MGGMSQRRAYLLLTLTMLFWAGNFIFGRVLIRELPPLLIVAARYSLAVLLMFPGARAAGAFAPALWRRHGWRLAVLGLLGAAVYSTLVYVALRFTETTNAALVNSAQPVVVAALAWVTVAEPVRPRQAAGMVLSLLGVAVVLSRGSWATLAALRFNPGDLLMVVNLCVWAVYSIGSRPYLRSIGPLAFTAASTAGALPVLWAGAAWEIAESPAPLRLSHIGGVGLVYMAVFASLLAYLWWNTAVGAVGPSRASVFLNLIPVYVAALAWLVLGEPVTATQVVGGVLVAAGVYLAAAAPADAPAATRAAPSPARRDAL